MRVSACRRIALTMAVVVVSAMVLAPSAMAAGAPTVEKLEPNSGPTYGGTIVRIVGVNLEEVRSVEFGVLQGKIIEEKCESTVPCRELVVESPSHVPGQTEVTVTTAGGTSARNEGDLFNYIQPEKLICQSEEAAGKLPPGTLSCISLENHEVLGRLTDRKLNQSIELQEGTFNGFVAFTSFFPIGGTIHGIIAAKPFEATIKVFGVAAKVGLTFEQVGEANGSIEEIARSNCPAELFQRCFHESIPTQVNLGFTSITLPGVTIPLSCKTATPVSLPLEANLLGPAETINGGGSHFTGTTTFPTVKCEGPLGTVESVVLSALLSGPNNAYSITIRERFFG